MSGPDMNILDFDKIQSIFDLDDIVFTGPEVIANQNLPLF
jgi:hypothetical protein